MDWAGMRVVFVLWPGQLATTLRALQPQGHVLIFSIFLENTDADLQAQSEEKPVPAAPVPSPVAPAPVPSRRNPPGGKSSLVLG